MCIHCGCPITSVINGHLFHPSSRPLREINCDIDTSGEENFNIFFLRISSITVVVQEEKKRRKNRFLVTPILRLIKSIFLEHYLYMYYTMMSSTNVWQNHLKILSIQLILSSHSLGTFLFIYSDHSQIIFTVFVISVKICLESRCFANDINVIQL